MNNIAVFASGSGTNAENLVKYFTNHSDVSVKLMMCNNKDALVFERMKKYNIPSVLINKSDFENGVVSQILKEHQIDYIILAGFLKLIPASLIKSYPNKIINIHPALLPKYGGKGMYGMHIHEAVVKSKEKATGITIHYVNERFDEGEIIAQYDVAIKESDSATDVALKIHELEMKWFPKVVEKLITNK